MNRRAFVYSSCALALAVGATGLVRCSKDDDPDPNSDPGNGNNNTPKLTANLDNELTSVGSSKTGSNVIVIRIASGNVSASFVALSTICTHEQCTVGYQSGQSRFVCPCHGSIYDINGSVLQGPAPSALAKYTVSIDNNTLSVS